MFVWRYCQQPDQSHLFVLFLVGRCSGKICSGASNFILSRLLGFGDAVYRAFWHRSRSHPRRAPCLALRNGTSAQRTSNCLGVIENIPQPLTKVWNQTHRLPSLQKSVSFCYIPYRPIDLANKLIRNLEPKENIVSTRWVTRKWFVKDWVEVYATFKA